jgi:hypothetical protein
VCSDGSAQLPVLLPDYQLNHHNGVPVEAALPRRSHSGSKGSLTSSQSFKCNFEEEQIMQAIRTVSSYITFLGKGGLCLYVYGLKTSVLPTSIWHSQMCQ